MRREYTSIPERGPVAMSEVYEVDSHAFRTALPLIAASKWSVVLGSRRLCQ